MFDMKLIGQRISVMRKDANLTQMELANKLGISAQAVSNWERGVSMPDISNLGLLASELGVTVDEIIGDEKITSIIKGDSPFENLSIEEFNAVSPLLDADKNIELLENHVVKINVASSDSNELNFSALSMSQEEIDAYAKKAMENGNIAMLALFIKYVSQAAADEMFDLAIESGNTATVAILSKYASDDELNEGFEKAFNSNNIGLTAILMKKRRK